MLYPSMQDLLGKIDNRYLLVNVTAKRAREIAEKFDRAEEPMSEKPVRMAISEISDGRTVGALKDGVQGGA